MERRIFNKFKSLGVDAESKLGKSLIKLDGLYEELDKAEKENKKNNKKIKQLREDIEFLENMIMYMFNKQSRENDI